jgi:hypothetical protein
MYITFSILMKLKDIGYGMKDSCEESSHVIIAIILETVTENPNHLRFAA